MATTMKSRTRRSPQQWEDSAKEILPKLQSGASLAELGYNTDAMRVALAQIGYDSHGEPIRIKKITAASRGTMARRVAKRRRDGAQWWRLIAETGFSYGGLKSLLEEFDYDVDGNEVTKS